MIKSVTGRIVLSFLILVALSSLTIAQDEESFSGIITSISDNVISVEAEGDDGEIILKSFKVTESTKIYIGEEEATLDELEEDDSVEIFFSKSEDGLTAIKVVVTR